MDSDDLPRGLILSRRDALKALGVSGAALLAACAPVQSDLPQPAIGEQDPTLPAERTSELPTCVVRPELAEGPYYVDAAFNRSDIRSDPGTGLVKEGVLLNLTFKVMQVMDGSCVPLQGSKVEVWHCDALGVYSGVSDPGFDTTSRKFLRGYQVTDANGQAFFTTIYPGWYPGRTVHVHFKVQHDAPEKSSIFTSQLFFDEAVSDRVFALPPYSSRGQREITNSTDRIFDSQLLMNVAPANDGYAGSFDLGMQLD